MLEDLEMLHGTPRNPCGLLVLVVDDHPQIRRYIRAVLQTTGVQVLEAGDGLEALEIFQARDGRIDLVITDIHMPRMKGTDLALSLRSIRPTVPLIFVSSEGAPVAMQNPKDGFGFLEKPFGPRDLLNAAGQFLDRIAVAS
jgi:CheY-like chemotaxis protein